jgi:hypothetical protein
MVDIGLISISFFGADHSTQSYIDDSGTFRYERDRDGAEFVYEVTLAASRSVTIRVVAFGKNRDLDELEADAKAQLTRVLLALGKAGEAQAAAASKGPAVAAE